mgnify:CR=1 FL=1
MSKPQRRRKIPLMAAPTEPHALRRFWRSVVIRALLDVHAISVRCAGASPETLQDTVYDGVLEWPTARDWIFDRQHHDWFAEVCAAAGLHWTAVRDAARRIEAGDEKAIEALHVFARNY